MNQQLKTILQITPVKIYGLPGEKKDEPNFKDLIDAFACDLALYREGKWDKAISHRQCMYIERCNNLKQHPPAQPWDSVFVMTKK